MSLAISFSGGGVRAAAHVGVITALEESGITASAISGVSSGGIVAGLYALNKSSDELIEIIKHLSKHSKKLIDPDICGIVMASLSLIFNKKCMFNSMNFCNDVKAKDGNIKLPGVIKGEHLEKYLYSITDGTSIENINKCKQLIIPSVDINTGKTIAYTNIKNLLFLDNVDWKRHGRLAEIMRASTAVPIVFRPKKIDNMCLVDGGIHDNTPVELLMSCGHRNILSVDISSTGKTNCDNIFKIASRSLTVVRDRITSFIPSSERLTLKPEGLENVGLLAFECMEHCFMAGYKETKKHIENIREIIAN